VNATALAFPLCFACTAATSTVPPSADTGGGGDPGDTAGGDSNDTGDSSDTGGGGSTVEERTGRIKLLDPLDEPDRYCVDVLGHDADIQLDGPLQAHTCKDTDDQLFTMGEPAPGMVLLTNYDRCLAAASGNASAPLFVRECDEADALQSWSLDASAHFVNAASPSLCAAAAADSEPANGGFLKRDLALVECAAADAALSTWEVPGGELGA
jgi:hypothetical protein